MKLFTISFGVLAVLSVAACDRHKPDTMSFFVTSVPAGDGGNIGGLEGADAHCQKLAEAAGSKGRQWRAYLSAAAEGDRPAVNARDRIGKGPWFNSRGVQIAANLDELHSANNGIGTMTALIETGQRANFPHDMMTGSNADGTLAAGDATCQNWRSTDGQTIFGHSDRVGGRGRDSTSWNSAHPSEGCSVAAMRETGGSGLFYCFAIN
jgi:hypothetical protein